MKSLAIHKHYQKSIPILVAKKNTVPKVVLILI